MHLKCENHSSRGFKLSLSACREKGFLYTVGANVNWCSRMNISKNLKTELPRDLATPLLGI